MYGLVKAFAGCLADKRAPEKIRHTLAELIGSGSSASRAATPTATMPTILADDPVHKLLLGRDPVAGAPLGVATDDLAVREQPGPRRALSHGAGVGGERHRAAPAPAGAAGAAHHHRSGPDRRPDAWRTTAFVLQRTLRRLVLSAAARVPDLQRRDGAVSVRGGAAAGQCGGGRREPGPAETAAADAAGGVSARRRFLVRLDGGFATPEVFDFLEAEPGLDYVVAMGRNAVLVRQAESAMAAARAQSGASGRTEHVYTDTRYAARTWKPRTPGRDQGRSGPASRAASRGTIRASS